MSYLRLMKSIWIMDRIRESDDWCKIQRTNPGNLYDRCVREMDRVSMNRTKICLQGESNHRWQRLRTECSRIVGSRVLRPQLSMVLQLPEEAFLIWPKAPPDHDALQAAHLGVLLDV
jgi:hypothetical protein